MSDTMNLINIIFYFSVLVIAVYHIHKQDQIIQNLCASIFKLQSIINQLEKKEDAHVSIQ